MTRSVSFILLCTAFGMLLAFLSIKLGLPTGWIGGLTLIGWALYSKRNWLNIENSTGLEPGPPERLARLYSAGIAMLFGHLVFSLTYPGIDLHVGSGNSLAIDSWVMVAALFIAGFFFRTIKKIQDERDKAIKAGGTRAGYVSLIILLTLLLSFLGFFPPEMTEKLSHFEIGNILVALILGSILIKYSAELLAYANDTKAAVAMEFDT